MDRVVPQRDVRVQRRPRARRALRTVQPLDPSPSSKRASPTCGRRSSRSAPRRARSCSNTSRASRLYEDQLHAVITVNPRALAIADSLDRERAPGQDPRPAARHSGRAQGQHSHDRHADDRRRAGVRRSRAAVRSDAHEEPRGRRRDHPRQDAAHRARQLGRERNARQLQRTQWPGHESRGIRAAIRASNSSTDVPCSAPAARARAPAPT